MRAPFYIYSVLGLVAIILASRIWSSTLWLLLIHLPVVAIGIYDMFQSKHSLWRNYPVLARFRWAFEWLRPMIYQYFIESETDGAPISRMYRSVVYQRAKKVRDTVPFGTKVDVYRVGYEWMDHSFSALGFDEVDKNLRVNVGGALCSQPYSASLLNISAMSFGSLSRNAILALNGGAKLGGFAHNTGEGGLSPHHLEKGGDIIWQIGTGYFGCRNNQGEFSDKLFQKNALLDNVKMIEIKLSQGAKPGHGGILPGAKNTDEIARIRMVEPHTTVESPPTHSAFNSPKSLLKFIDRLRQLSGGKPIGFKLCLGRKSEFMALCKAMVETGIRPDFITVDGGEGGTGAAPLEHTNSVGTPLRDGLAFVVDCLMGFDLKREIRVIASGKVLAGFHVIKNLALGADLCYSARGMMLSMGCIQSLTCNTNECPTGIATQEPALYKGLVVSDKQQRVAAFQEETLESVAELMAASGFTDHALFNRSHIQRRVTAMEVKRYDEVFPYVRVGCFLEGEIPERYRLPMAESSAESFRAKSSNGLEACSLKELNAVM